MGDYTTLRHGPADVTFEGGGARDDSTGKPRYDLIPPGPLKRTAELYERGGRIRGDHNWTRGVPVSRCIESAMRHLEQFRAGDTDEDHAAAVVWNVLGAMHFEGTEWDDRHDWTVPPRPKPFGAKEPVFTEEMVQAAYNAEEPFLPTSRPELRHHARYPSTVGEQPTQGDAGLDGPPATVGDPSVSHLHDIPAKER
jgi:hypothetical protein